MKGHTSKEEYSTWKYLKGVSRKEFAPLSGLPHSSGSQFFLLKVAPFLRWESYTRNVDIFRYSGLPSKREAKIYSLRVLPLWGVSIQLNT